MSDQSCARCGSRGTSHLGYCKVCLEEVCAHCGNVQTSQAAGDIVVHTDCLEANPGVLGTNFKFLRVKRAR